jgi:hypothetical protein
MTVVTDDEGNLMKSTQKKELQRRLWENNAKRMRRSIEQKLQAICPTYLPRFGGYDETLHFGEKYWAHVNRQPEHEVSSFTDCKKYLIHALLPPNQNVIYFHNQANSSGVLLISLAELLAGAQELQKEFGPDFLFMSTDEQFGFCFEEAEYESYLRMWGFSDKHEQSSAI